MVVDEKSQSQRFSQGRKKPSIRLHILVVLGCNGCARTRIPARERRVATVSSVGHCVSDKINKDLFTTNHRYNCSQVTQLSSLTRVCLPRQGSPSSFQRFDPFFRGLRSLASLYTRPCRCIRKDTTDALTAGPGATLARKEHPVIGT